jgi:Glycosyl hydrolase family 14
VVETAAAAGVPLSGENALQRYDHFAFDRIAESAFGHQARAGCLESLTFLRMGEPSLLHACSAEAAAPPCLPDVGLWHTPSKQMNTGVRQAICTCCGFHAFRVTLLFMSLQATSCLTTGMPSATSCGACGRRPQMNEGASAPYQPPAAGQTGMQRPFCEVALIKQACSLGAKFSATATLGITCIIMC